jgi:hypothetical protein
MRAAHENTRRPPTNCPSLGGCLAVHSYRDKLSVSLFLADHLHASTRCQQQTTAFVVYRPVSLTPTFVLQVQHYRYGLTFFASLVYYTRTLLLFGRRVVWRCQRVRWRTTRHSRATRCLCRCNATLVYGSHRAAAVCLNDGYVCCLPCCWYIATRYLCRVPLHCRLLHYVCGWRPFTAAAILFWLAFAAFATRCVVTLVRC